MLTIRQKNDVYRHRSLSLSLRITGQPVKFSYPWGETPTFIFPFAQRFFFSEEKESETSSEEDPVKDLLGGSSTSESDASEEMG